MAEPDPGFGWQPALDGLRALCIGVVLAFHLGASWMPGGYLGVSVFFTLSGYLITSLLLDEVDRTGRIDAATFYVRRLRRLLPAALLCLGAIAVLAVAGVFGTRSDLRGGILASALQVANWESLLSDRSYADLFASPSPVAHFWSLAIEEQFYWIWPAALALVVGWSRRSRRPRRRVATYLVGAYAVLALSAPLTASLLGPDAAYLASWPRFAEILAGAALAALLVNRTVPARAGVLAPVCAALVLALCVVTPSGAGWAYAGGLPLFALVSVALIVGLQAPSRTRRVLSTGPAVWVGKVSYGLYLVHWPVIVLLDEQRTGLDGPSLAALRLGVTLGITVLSYRLVEQPVRTGRLLAPAGRYIPVAGAVTAGVALFAATIVPGGPVRDASEPVVLAAGMPGAAALERGGDPGLAAAAGARGESASAPVQLSTVAFFGDSVPDWLIRDAAASYRRTDLVVVDAAQEACEGMVDPPPTRDRRNKLLATPSDCPPWTVAYPDVVEHGDRPVDLAVVFAGQFVALDAFVDERWVHPCTDLGWYVDDLAARVEYLREHTTSVFLVLPAVPGPGVTWMVPDDYEDRYRCLRSALDAYAADAGVATIDLTRLLCPTPASDCTTLRKRDGQHVDPEDAPLVLDWLLGQVKAGLREGTGSPTSALRSADPVGARAALPAFLRSGTRQA